MALTDRTDERRRALDKACHHSGQPRHTTLASAQAIGDGQIDNRDGRLDRRRLRRGSRGLQRRYLDTGALTEPTSEHLGKLLVVERLHQEVVHPGLEAFRFYLVEGV